MSIKTYLTTSELAARIKYDERYIRNTLIHSVLIEGVHFIKPFQGRKILFIWEEVEAEMNRGHCTSDLMQGVV